MKNQRPSVLFVIPTLFNNPNAVRNCVIELRRNLTNFDITYKICVVINVSNEDFKSFDFPDGTEKLSGNLQFNIARALNTAARCNMDYEYFCFVDEGLRISNSVWIERILDLFRSDPRTGLVGCRPHSTFQHFHKKVSDTPPIYEVLWSDGILFCGMETLKRFGLFDEAFFADCELQDFGYRIYQAGYRNYYWENLADSHEFVPFKIKHVDRVAILLTRNRSRHLFNFRWREFEKNLGFQTFPGTASTIRYYLAMMNVLRSSSARFVRNLFGFQKI